MSQINLLQLSVISLSAIHTGASSSPRSRRRRITFMRLSFIFIRKLVKINITLSINGLSSRIIHATIDNHLIHTAQLIILLVHNRPSTKSTITNNSSGATISNICLGSILQTSNLKRKLGLLRIRSISTRIIISNKRAFAIYTLNFISTCLIIKRQKTRLTNRGRTSTMQINIHTMSSNNLNATRSITTFVHKNAIRRNSAIIGNTNNLISITLETNTSKTKRVRNLHRIDHRIVILRSSLSSRHRNTTIQSWIPIELRTKTNMSFSSRRAKRIVINYKIRRHVLNTLLHRRRINVHIIIPRDRKVTRIIKLSRRIRRDLTIIRNLPITSSVNTSITVPIKNKGSSLTSRRPNSIRRQNKSGTLKSNLIKNIGQLLILFSTTKNRPQGNLAYTCTLITTTKHHRARDLNLDHKIRTVTLLSCSTHITTCCSSRIRPTIACHEWSGKTQAHHGCDTFMARIYPRVG